MLTVRGTNKRKTKGAIDFCVAMKRRGKTKPFLPYLRKVHQIMFPYQECSQDKRDSNVQGSAFRHLPSNNGSVTN